MRRRIIVVVAVLGTALAVGSVQAAADHDRGFGGKRFNTLLSGYEEVPALSVDGRGSFVAEIDKSETTISFTLRYEGLTGDATAAHIHLGQPGVAAGVIAFLCGGGGQDPCPGAGGTVTGTIDASKVVGPAGQGIEPGEFDELVAAMRAGATYVNVHTALFPGGEIRGQVK